MKTRCPVCGTTLSLDALINHDSAREAVLNALMLSPELGKALIGYLGLFRPAERDLTMNRVASLINQLLPDIQSARISRNGHVHDAPIEAWIYAFNAAVNARDNGKLKLPLKTHGWLYEVISTYQPDVVNHYSVVQHATNKHTPNTPKNQSKTLGAVGKLQKFIGGADVE